MDASVANNVVTLCAVGVGSGLTWLITRYQILSSVALARKDKWRNELASLLSEFGGKCYALVSSLRVESKGSKEEMQLMEQVGELRLRLLLILNPEIKGQAELIACINHAMGNAMETKRQGKEPAAFSDYMQAMLDAARKFTCPND
jgi:hypothetical protein